MKRVSRKRFYRSTVIVLLLPFLMLSFLTPLALAISQGYSTEDEGLRPGMVVALSDNTTAENPKVERAALDVESKIIGVTTRLNDNTVTVASSDSLVYVQNSGEAEVFVSDLNGLVKSGDLLAPSPLLGILMKADESSAPIIGIALEEFSEEDSEAKTIEYNSAGRNVKIDRLKINLDHMAESNQQANATDSSLERLGRAVVGRDVGEIQVLIALMIFMIVLAAEGSIIYGAITSAITALGRNPLASSIIRREMIRVIIVALLVLIIGVASIYAVLWI